jgi:hypothetical protein
LFQEFQPMGGVSARLLEGDGFSWANKSWANKSWCKSGEKMIDIRRNAIIFIPAL